MNIVGASYNLGARLHGRKLTGKVILPHADTSVWRVAPRWLSCVEIRSPTCLHCSSDSQILCAQVPAPTLARPLGSPSRIKDSRASDVARSRQSSSRQSPWWTLNPNLKDRRIVGETNCESSGKISENVWDEQFPVAEELQVGCFDFESSLACQVYPASLEVPQMYGAASQLWARRCSPLDKVMKQSKSCDCVQQEKAISRGGV